MIIGIDPGKSGAICVLSREGAIIQLDRMPFLRVEMQRYFSELTNRFNPDRYTAYIELLHATPSQQSAREGSDYYCNNISTWSLSANYEMVQSALHYHEIKTIPVLPIKWQMGVGAKDGVEKFTYEEGKQRCWEVAKRLYPNHKVYKYAADALLIAEYGRRVDDRQ